MPETVTIGQLRWPVTIARRVQTPAGDGSGVAETLRHVLATNAKIAPLGAVSYYGAAAVDTPFTHKVWVRYLDWLDTRHVILRATRTPDGSYRSELFRIRRVGDWEGRKRFSYLEVEEERQIEAELDPVGAEAPRSPGALDLADVSDPGVPPEALPSPDAPTTNVFPGFGGRVRFTQPTPSAVWVIRHALAARPEIEVYDDAGGVVEGDPSFPDATTVLLRFSRPIAGTAYLT